MGKKLDAGLEAISVLLIQIRKALVCLVDAASLLVAILERMFEQILADGSL